MNYNDPVPKKQSDNSQESNNHKRVWVFRLVRDIFGNLSKVTLIVIISLAIMFTCFWSMIDYCTEQRVQLCGDILTMCSCLLAFIITGFSIILTLDEKIIKKLSGRYKNEKDKGCLYSFFLKTKSNPYDILCSSFSSSCIVLMLNISMLVLYKNIPNPCYDHDIFFVFIQFFTICSVFLVIDLIFHLYAVSTYLNERHHEIKCNFGRRKNK